MLRKPTVTRSKITTGRSRVLAVAASVSFMLFWPVLTFPAETNALNSAQKKLLLSKQLAWGIPRPCFYPGWLAFNFSNICAMKLQAEYVSSADLSSDENYSLRRKEEAINLRKDTDTNDPEYRGGEGCLLWRVSATRVVEGQEIKLPGPVVGMFSSYHQVLFSDQEFGLARKGLLTVDAVVFAGLVSDSNSPAMTEGQSEEARDYGLLYADGFWYRILLRKPSGPYGLGFLFETDDGVDSGWKGSAEILCDAIDDARRGKARCQWGPYRQNTRWVRSLYIGHVDGLVNSLTAVRKDGDLCDIIAACGSGDEIFSVNSKLLAAARVDGETNSSAVVRVKQSSRSKSILCSKFESGGDGRCDMCCADDGGVTYWCSSNRGDKWIKRLQWAPEGTRIHAMSEIALRGGTGQYGVVLFTDGGPLVVTVEGGSNAVARVLEKDRGKAPKGEWRKASVTIGEVGDFNGDGVPDVFEFSNVAGCWVYFGKEDGSFIASELPGMSIQTNELRQIHALDYDGDGKTDLLVEYAQGRIFWWRNIGGRNWFHHERNMGDLRFSERAGINVGLHETSADRLLTGDINGDGIVDLMFYGASSLASPLVLVNRGYGICERVPSLCFDARLKKYHSGNMQPVVVPGVENGCQAACLVDINGDRLDDALFVLQDGSVWVLLNGSRVQP